jgi:pre-rRNA-processing protein TSR3
LFSTFSIMTPITIIRHKREKLSKCSLRGLEQRPNIQFYVKKKGFLFDAEGFTVLSPTAPLLSIADQGKPLLILDSTWSLLPELEACLLGAPIYRSLPSTIQTAYPRINKKGLDPAQGLASVEALYAAKRLLGEEDVSLLDYYYWKDAFLRQFQ